MIKFALQKGVKFMLIFPVLTHDTHREYCERIHHGGTPPQQLTTMDRCNRLILTIIFGINSLITDEQNAVLTSRASAESFNQFVSGLRYSLIIRG